MLNERLKRIEDNLIEGLGGKLRGTDREYTLSHLKEAYRLATQPSPLPGPWPYITAYRLAHFQMRQAQNLAELQEINELLNECCSPFAPIEIRLTALIFRLSVLHRLGASLIEQKQVFEEAKHLHSRTPGIANKRLRKLASQVQDPVTNLLELSAYFAGFDLGPLTSSGVKTSILPELRGEIWHIAGTRGLGSNLIYSAEIAEEVLRARVASDEVDIAFRLEKNGEAFSGAMIKPNVPRGAIPEKAFGHMALACISQDHGVWKKYRADTEAEVRKDIHEARNALQEFFSGIEMVLSCPQRNGVYCFQPQLRVAAMVPDEFFETFREGRG